MVKISQLPNGGFLNPTGSIPATENGVTYRVTGTVYTSVMQPPYNAKGDGVTDDSAAFQAAHDAIYNAAVISGNNNPSGMVLVPSAKYKMNSGLTWVPWIKMVSQGPVYLDFSGMSTNSTAIRSSNDIGPAASPGKNSANTGPFLNGANGVIYIAGPGKSTGSSIGLDLGNSFADSSSIRDYRDVQIDSVVVSSFVTLLNLRAYDTYLMTIRNSRFEISGANCVAASDSQNTNSGERMTFENCTFAGGANGFGITTPGFDFNFISCSFDFNTSSAIQFNVGAGFQKITLTDCHLESSNNVAIINSSLASSNGLTVQLTDCKIVPTINLPAPSGAYTTGASSPWTALFKGKMLFSYNGLQIGGYAHPAYGASDGLFMCDSNVSLVGAQNLSFTGFRQVISASRILNQNYNFNTGTSGTSLDYSTITGWTFVSVNGITAALSNTQAYSGSANSLAFTYTGGSNFYVMDSAPFNINQGDLLTFQNVLYGGASTGTINCQMQLIQYQEGVVVPVVISSITRSGNTATVTTATDHGLSAAHNVFVIGADQTEYNGHKVIRAVTHNTFTYSVATTATTPATGTITYQVEPLIPLNVGSATGDSFKSIYTTTTDPAYTGNRLWWAKQGVLTSGFVITVLVPGVTMGRMRLTVSNLDSGDTVYLGTSLMEKT